MSLYGRLSLVELWGLRALSLGAAWLALGLFIPTAQPIEIAWTEIAFVGLVYAVKTLARRWDIERLRRARGVNGELQIISLGHLRGRAIAAAIQMLSLTAGVSSLLAEEPVHRDVTAQTLVSTLALIGVGVLTTVGAWYAEHDLSRQISYRRAVEDLAGVAVIEP